MAPTQMTDGRRAILFAIPFPDLFARAVLDLHRVVRVRAALVRAGLYRRVLAACVA